MLNKWIYKKKLMKIIYKKKLMKIIYFLSDVLVNHLSDVLKTDR